MKLPQIQRWLAGGVVAAAALQLFGCGDGTQPEEREIVYFSALETDEARPSPIADPGPALRADQGQLYEPIIDGFLKNYAKLLRRDDIESQLERIENVFLAAGRYLDLVVIYQGDVEEFGLRSPVAERLAWAYIRLGQEKQAADLLAKLQEAKPSSPTVYFLIGALELEKGLEDEESKRRLVEAWSKVLELDPDFVGYEGIGAERVRAQLEATRAQLPGGVKPPAAAMVKAPEPPRAAEEEAEEAPTAEAVEVPPEAGAPVEIEAEAEVEAPEQEPAPAKPTPRQEYQLLIARGELALSQGAAKQAYDHFRKAQDLQPQGFEALFGQIRASWVNESSRNELARQVRALAERKDLSARQAYELGIFAYSKMSDAETAASLWTQVQAKDPQLAERLGVAGLLEKVR